MSYLGLPLVPKGLFAFRPGLSIHVLVNLRVFCICVDVSYGDVRIVGLESADKCIAYLMNFLRWALRVGSRSAMLQHPCDANDFISGQFVVGLR